MYEVALHNVSYMSRNFTPILHILYRCKDDLRCEEFLLCFPRWSCMCFVLRSLSSRAAARYCSKVCCADSESYVFEPRPLFLMHVCCCMLYW